MQKRVGWRKSCAHSYIPISEYRPEPALLPPDVLDGRQPAVFPADHNIRQAIRSEIYVSLRKKWPEAETCSSTARQGPDGLVGKRSTMNAWPRKDAVAALEPFDVLVRRFGVLVEVAAVDERLLQLAADQRARARQSVAEPDDLDTGMEEVSAQII